MAVVLLACMCGDAYAVAAVSEAGSTTQSETRKKRELKARYYFLEGSLMAARGEMDKAYEYFRKAYEEDPEYTDAAFTYGSQRMFVRNDTLQSNKELERSRSMMQKYVDINPKDVYSAQLYGYITAALDTLEESVRVLENTYSILPAETQLLQTLADSYMRMQRGEDALRSLQRYETIEGKGKEVSLKKITILLAMQDTVGAVEEVNSLVSANPRDPYSRILKGHLYEAIGEPDSMYQAYKSAEELSPGNGAVKMSLAQYYRTVGDSVMLDNMMYEALLSEEFELEDKLGILGDYLQKLLDESGDKSRGDYLFRVLQEQYPHEPEVLEMSARYSGAKGDYSAAAEAIGYALDMDGSNENYWLMLLSFELTAREYEKAVKDYERSKEYFEPSLRLKNLYAMSASMLEDTGQAEKILTELLNEVIPPQDNEGFNEKALEPLRKKMNYDELLWVSSLYCMLGDLYYKRGEADKGFEEYEKSLYFLKDNALTLNNFAYFLSEEDRELERAAEMSRRSLELVENNPTYLDTYAWILYKMGEYEAAYDTMKLALEMASEEGDDNEEFQIHWEAIEKAVPESVKEMEKDLTTDPIVIPEI